MRIVHVAPFYYPIIGGVEEVVKRIAEFMASRGYEVYVITYNRTRVSGIGCLPRKETINGVHVIRLKPDFIWSHGTYSSELPNVLKKLRPDIIHVHVWRHPHVFQLIKLKKKLSFKSVLHVHAPFHRLGQLGALTWFYHRVIDLLLKKVLGEYDILIALTPHERTILINKLRIEKSKVIVIPHGIDDKLVDIEHNHTIKYGTETNTILYLGRISRSKNVDLLAKAVARAKRRIPSINLVLAGPDEGLISKLARYLMKHNVKFEYLGMVSEHEKYKLYSRCTIFTHPAIYEPFGITLLEAQAFGKPCIITGEGGQLYAAPPGLTSLYSKPNPKDFASTIVTLLINKYLYDKLSKNARTWASKHTWSKILPKYEEIYKHLNKHDF